MIVSATFNKRLLIVWLILTAMTLSYVWIDHTADQSFADRYRHNSAGSPNFLGSKLSTSQTRWH